MERKKVPFCCSFLLVCLLAYREPQLHSMKSQRGAQWPSVCTPSPTKHGKLTAAPSTRHFIPSPSPYHFERTGDSSLKGQEIAPQSLMYSDRFTCKQLTTCLSLPRTHSHPPILNTAYDHKGQKHDHCTFHVSVRERTILSYTVY